ncbi:Uma2 family endonuclease [cf. Phormidesmis sp. LEGE 11477]|uniref:Uma2 family endonuclease n=1 Tax=cf. Phormidesmis sp. LEGE 11477 TaxID=1828680 RepID=UPI00187E323D|nr:Uma2 family endonuclease [cf. Phormidesmis sp. LEGE 11477]MBE9059971.1 Uma2 family endonuclease [cf. Phormidesmis sp. LEGE 11477]
MTVVTAKWTLAEYHRMIAAGVLDDRQVELIKGEIVEMPPEGEPHAYFVSESGEYLVRLLGERAKVRYGNPITLPNQSEPEPDIAIVQRLGKEYLQHHPYPENIFWLIEYSDTSLSKDLNLKSQAYAEVDIAEYWVVDLKARSLLVFRKPISGRYSSRSSYTTGQITPLAFPDVSISVDAIINRS